MIQDNLNTINHQIAETCLKIDKNPNSIVLVNVSKTKPLSILEEGYKAGMRIFGENKVQELCDKYEQFKKEDIQWHMIGHLQRNKVKYIIDKVDLIHSVDSYRLAETISKEAKKKDIIAHILIQVNVAQEESKYGFESQNVIGMVKSIHRLENLKIEGLMTIAPFVDNPEENRPIFKALYQLSVDIKEQNLDNVSMDVLSMGMTNDFKVAIEEGATMIRIGTALFGDRNY
ncbi:YggS family pyridoxal phosphate-dependent enzyme [Petrocella sp. FN5]|uniref:YggS family pyridoxal phosphate-dependent enzyme n=1 Tax=Petrocella sp. FN5 TaxID=3032002 RepID=UPI0023DB59A2|nr:YggS family pyridoxal phosphate-dependent enzyme [Petrocella sp. FN5]MDF1616315.1 YggS family pyridoxal phosphate-dependent enzyme [Petrocella sp. FN5]